jgi:hypothetical protein
VPPEKFCHMREKCKPRPTALVAAAYHEAGHAVVAFHLRIGLKKRAISIIEDEESLGRVGTRLALGERPDIAASDRGRRRAEKHAVVSLAGIEAQRKFCPGSVRKYHGSVDYHNAVDIMSYYIPSDKQLEAYFKYLLVHTRELIELRHVSRLIEILADELLLKKEMSGPDVMALLRSAILREACKPRGI